MAEFESKIYRIKVEQHPNADRLELARIGDFLCVVGKDNFKNGDLGAYIPEAAVVPEDMISEMGLEGHLAGNQKNRVKAVKLRGVLSQGLVYPVSAKRLCNEGVVEGDDVTAILGLVKYEPPIPTHMSGQMESYFGKTLKYDIENIKKYPNAFWPGEEVVFTEKLHGTWCAISWHDDDGYRVTSKGNSEKGRVFKLNDENKDNLYVKAYYEAQEDGLNDLVGKIRLSVQNCLIHVLGEIYGKGVQDLHYGMQRPAFRVFDIHIREGGTGWYLDSDLVQKFVEHVGMEYVPVLYKGPFSKEVLEEHTNGVTMLGGNNIREGVVIRPIHERKDEIGSRVVFKSVSEKYLLRKGGTEMA